MAEQYTPEEARLLLRIARETLEQATSGEEPVLPDLAHLPPALREPRACFVTLRDTGGELRGCTGTLSARKPLAHEVRDIAIQTAFSDPRFPPVMAWELPGLVIEVSVLTPSEPLAFDRPDDIPGLLRPEVDGVVLQIGPNRATFLPQVWERIPDPNQFLDMLCQKMGLPAGAWRQPDVQVFTYRCIVVEESAPVGS